MLRFNNILKEYLDQDALYKALEPHLATMNVTEPLAIAAAYFDALNLYIGHEDRSRITKFYNDPNNKPLFDIVQAEFKRDINNELKIYRGIVFSEYAEEYWDVMAQQRLGNIINISSPEKQLQSWSADLKIARGFLWISKNNDSNKQQIGIVVSMTVPIDKIIFYWSLFTEQYHQYTLRNEKEVLIDMTDDMECAIEEAYTYIPNDNQHLEDSLYWHKVDNKVYAFGDILEERVLSVDKLDVEDIVREFNQGDISLIDIEKRFDAAQKSHILDTIDVTSVLLGIVKHVKADHLGWLEDDGDMIRYLYNDLIEVYLGDDSYNAKLVIINMLMKWHNDIPADVLKDIYETYGDDKAIVQALVQYAGLDPDTGRYDIDSGTYKPISFKNVINKSADSGQQELPI